jgi:hypothetical protein
LASTQFGRHALVSRLKANPRSHSSPGSTTSSPHTGGAPEVVVVPVEVVSPLSPVDSSGAGRSGAETSVGSVGSEVVGDPVVPVEGASRTDPGASSSPHADKSRRVSQM